MLASARDESSACKTASRLLLSHHSALEADAKRKEACGGDKASQVLLHHPSRSAKVEEEKLDEWAKYRVLKVLG